jgi:putative ABC transport system permease protein
MRKIALFVKMAARNMIKYGRRSAQSGATVFLGVFFVALAGSFLAGFAFRITQDFITAGGHVVVMAPGYAERREMMPLNRLIQGAEEARVALESAAPGVKAFASLYAPGLVSKGGKPEDAPGDGAVSQEDGSEGVLCVGVMPYAADSVNPAWRSVRGRIASGRFFEGPGDRGMILSDRTASAIGVEPGNTVIFLCSDAFGSFSMIELPLLAVFSADEYSEEFSCIIDLESMQTVTGAEDAAAQIASYAMDGDGLPLEPRSAAVTVRAVETKAVGLGLSPERWDAASGTMASMMGFLDAFMLIAYVLFAVVAVVGIMNSILLSVQDRIRDFGTLRAIAFTGNGVSAIIAVEALLLGACASFLAVLAAGGASAYFERHGIPIGQIMKGVWSAFPAELNTRTDLRQLLVCFAAGTMIPVLAALYPMGMMRKMSIREALGFV